MKKSLRSLLLLFSAAALSLLLASCVKQSQRSYSLDMRPMTIADSVNIEEYSSKYNGFDGVYLDYEKIIEHTTNKYEDGGSKVIAFMNSQDRSLAPVWWYHGISRQKYLILNPDNQKLTTFVLQTGKSARINGLYLRMSSPGEPVKTFGLGDLEKEYNSEGEITYKFIYSGVKKGTIIEEAFDLSYNMFKTRIPTVGDRDLQFELPCENLSFKFSYPLWWELKVKRLSEKATLDYTTTLDTSKHQRTISYSDKNIPGIKKEVFSPYFKEIGKYIHFMVSKLVVGTFSESTSEFWFEEAKEFMENLEDDERDETDGDVWEFTRELTSGCSTQLEKLDKIITYLQNNVEYHNYGQESYKKILKNKKGAILRITGLAQYMLSKAGLKSDMIILHSASDGYFDPDFITGYQFRYPAVRTMIDNKEYISFPCIKGIPVDYTLHDVLGQFALLIPYKGSPDLIKLSDSSQCKNSIIENYDLQIDESGIIRVKDEKLITGYAAFRVRSELFAMEDEKKESYIKDLLTFEGGSIKINNYEIENLDEPIKPLKITFDYTIDNLVTVTPEEIIFQTGGLLSPISYAGSEPDTLNRVNPVKIYVSEYNTRNIKLNFPKDWMLFTRVANMEYSNDFGSINVVYETSEGGLRIVQSHSLKRSSGPKEKIGELCQLISSKSRFNLPAIAFRRNSPQLQN